MPYTNWSSKFIAKYGTPPNAADYKGKQAQYKKDMLAFESKIMVSWDIPNDINADLPCLPNRLYINKDMVAPLERALRKLIAAYKAGKLKKSDSLKTWDGCYVIRNVRGSSTSLSRHSWAMAFDINAAWNGLGVKPVFSKEFVDIFKSEGFYWGGDFTRKDGMHFEMNIDLV